VTGGLEEWNEVSIGGVDGQDTKGTTFAEKGCQEKCGRIRGSAYSAWFVPR